MPLRRITQQTLIDTLAAGQAFQAKYLETCRLVSGLAEKLPPSDIAAAIIQLTSNPEFDLYDEANLFLLERGRIEGTQARNEYLRRRRDLKAEGPYRPITDDDLDAPMPEGLPSADLVDDESPGQ